jgi:Flp pilus assembly protein TadD
MTPANPRNLLAAAALAAFCATGCDQTPKSHPAPIRPAATARAKVAPPAPEPPKEIAFSDGDAGVIEAETRPDPIALQHVHGSGRINHVQRARELKNLGDPQGAMTEARRAIFDTPDDEEALQMVARLSRQTSQPSLGMEAYARLAEINPEDSAPLIAQARMLISLGDAEGAVKVGQEAILRDPENPETYHVTGRGFLSGGDLEPAMVMFGRTIELKPDHGYALNNLGFAFLRANRNEEAVEALTRAADLLPTVAYVHNNLGVALERVGRTEEADEAYTLSTTLSPKYVKARVNSARLKRTASISPEAMDSATDAMDVPAPVTNVPAADQELEQPGE